MDIFLTICVPGNHPVLHSITILVKISNYAFGNVSGDRRKIDVPVFLDDYYLCSSYEEYSALRETTHPNRTGRHPKRNYIPDHFGS